jgi:alkanesulfonate monooxygenase SsuD/methylene tetrahydromethanopterin reductase-like flavin-dependent oxidoreductase (luciferase family)
MLDDCAVAVDAGYDSVWIVEHHFTDYFPTPSPLLFLSHVAAKFPDLSLGTCVLVLPWYQPLRLAEELAMLSNLTRADLHIGVGRGTAKIEYDAFGVPMEESRTRFRDGVALIRAALGGGAFEFEGRSFRMHRRVQMRPPAKRDRIHLYGAIGSPQSAEIMGALALPPLSVGNFPFPVQKQILDTWSATLGAENGPEKYLKPIVIGCEIADTDEEARERARQVVPDFFRLQVQHYEVDQDHWKHIDGYQQFSRFFGNLRRLTDPRNLDPWMNFQLFGTPDTIERQIRRYMELGFNYFVLSAASPSMDPASRHAMLRRFMRDVAPRFRGEPMLARTADGRSVRTS